MMNILVQLEESPADTTLCTLDANSLYTNISHSDDILAKEEILEIQRTQ